MIDERELLCSAFERILTGEQVTISTDHWSVGTSGGVRVAQLFYDGGKAIYGFSLNEDRKGVYFFNTHREAEKGQGTISLVQLEDCLKFMARRRKKMVVLTFPTFDQKDSARWLEKNNYIHTQISPGTDGYVKEIYP
jgi:hypothetical protein